MKKEIEENEKIKSNSLCHFFIAIIAISLMSMLAFASGYRLKDIKQENNINYIKYRAEHEGRHAYISYLENNKSLDKIDLSNIDPKEGRNPSINLIWKYNKNNKYLVLSKEGTIDEISKNTSSYDFYSGLCRSIQDTKSDYFEKNIDYKKMPIKRTLNDIDENLDCIYKDDSFVIIYLLDKQFSNAPYKKPILF